MVDDSSRITRKPIDPDCLLDGELHLSIRMRLERVRELPVKGVANLRGVERVGGDVFATWEFVPGQTLEDFAKTASRDDVECVLRDAELIVAAMHGMGIVHGALHGRNVIVTGGGAGAGEVKLTHVSPLLFHDEQVDRDAIGDLRAAFLGDAATAATSPQEEADAFLRRRSAIVGAVAIAAAGLVMAATIARYVLNSDKDPYAPTSPGPADIRTNP